MIKRTKFLRKMDSSATKVVELYGIPTNTQGVDWAQVAERQHCPYLGRKCIKVRKSTPDQTIGTCTVMHSGLPVVICPIRFRERHQVFFDCLSLLTLHEPGNELHAVAEAEIPGGKIDFTLVSARRGKVKDFVGIELQTLDTTGTVWPERQRFLRSVGLPASKADLESTKPYGMNWKMSAKTILMQIHHKVETFEHLNKKIVLVVQDHFMAYMEREFSFGHLSNPARTGDSAHFHAYSLLREDAANRLELAMRKSTDAAGIANALELKVSAKVELEVIIETLEGKLSDATRLSFPLP